MNNPHVFVVAMTTGWSPSHSVRGQMWHLTVTLVAILRPDKRPPAGLTSAERGRRGLASGQIHHTALAAFRDQLDEASGQARPEPLDLP